MSIIIGCDSFLALRNVQIGNVGRCLAGTPVKVWVAPEHLAGSLEVKPENVAIGCLEEFDVWKHAELSRILNACSLARKCYYDPATIWSEFLHSSYRFNRTSLIRRAASVSRAAGRLSGYWLAGAAGFARRWRSDCAAALRGHRWTKLYRQRLLDEEAEVVAGFSPEGLREMALIEAANAAGIPTVVMIRSRDNLAAKIPYLPFADAYIVWSQVLREFLHSMYPEIPQDRIHVTGAPQFDHHLNPDCRLNKEELFSRIGLDPNRPLVLYTMATPGLIPHETAIVQHLAEAAHCGKLARGAQLLVRGHPRMFGSNVRLLDKEYPEARSYPAPTQAEYRGAAHEAQLVRHILEDEAMHLSLLAYQDVQVNVCGTMTIDSAILDKPTVNVFYDHVQGLSSAISVRRFYKRSDVKLMMSYGCSRLAYDGDHCIELINEYLTHPRLDAEGRKRARNEDCGPLDGKAGLRAARIIQTLRERRPALVSSL